MAGRPAVESQQVALEKHLGEKEVVRGECWGVFVPLLLVVLVADEELVVLVVGVAQEVLVVGAERRGVLVAVVRVEVLVAVAVVEVHGLALSLLFDAPSLHEVPAAPVAVLCLWVEVVVEVAVRVEVVVVEVLASCFGLAECPDWFFECD